MNKGLFVWTTYVNFKKLVLEALEEGRGMDIPYLLHSKKSLINTIK
jgi:hypothetical protein